MAEYNEDRLSDRTTSVICCKFYSGILNTRKNMADVGKKLRVNSETTDKIYEYGNRDAVMFCSSLWLSSP